MKKTKKKKKSASYKSEIGFDGDTNECQLIIYLKTKSETKAHKIAAEICKAVNG